MKLSHFDYKLPNKLLAQHPSNERDESKLMLLNRKEQTIEHLIFKDIKRFAQETKKNSTILSLERNSLYGGVSLFAPFFYKQSFVSVYCVSPKFKKRGAYNRVNVKTNFISMKKNYQFNYKKIKLPNSFADLIIVPNLMHHIDDVGVLLRQIKIILKKMEKFSEDL